MQIAELAVKSRLPAIYYQIEFVQDGGLMSYGVSVTDLFRRAATYVDKILKGAKPADLPVEQPKKFEFIINLKTAKQIGLTIPPNVLVRADRVRCVAQFNLSLKIWFFHSTNPCRLLPFKSHFPLSLSA